MTRPGSELDGRAREAQRLGILGGSFDPPHIGHLHVARAAREALGLDHIVFVPAARPPHKPDRVLSRGDVRVEMLALLIEDEPESSIWTVELEREGPSYTIDTLRELRAAVGPEPELFLLIGSDNLAGFPGWRERDELLQRARVVCVLRSGAPGARGAGLESLPAPLRGRIELLDVPPVDVTASELRARLARGEDAGNALPPKLAEYVRSRNIYSAE